MWTSEVNAGDFQCVTVSESVSVCPASNSGCVWDRDEEDSRLGTQCEGVRREERSQNYLMDSMLCF